MGLGKKILYLTDIYPQKVKGKPIRKYKTRNTGQDR